jgi:hypothetical protein
MLVFLDASLPVGLKYSAVKYAIFKLLRVFG